MEAEVRSWSLRAPSLGRALQSFMIPLKKRGTGPTGSGYPFPTNKVPMNSESWIRGESCGRLPASTGPGKGRR